jgi:tripartite-type tricarboxylate transporter receptor subunit TctC
MVRAAIAAALAAGLTLVHTASFAETYPAQPVRLYVSATPGAPADLTARVLARRLSQALGQSFSVESARPGPETIDLVARAPKDGYTLLMGTATNAINASLASGGTASFAGGLTPVALVATVPQVLVVPPSLGVATVADLIALAKARPGQLSFGSSGEGSATHLAGEMFNLSAGVQMSHTAYPSTAAAVTDLLAGRISAMFAPASAVLQLLEQGKLKGLATTGARRAMVMPSLPTMQEAGLRDFETGLWFGLFAPAGTPQELIDRLADGINGALQATDVRSALRVQGIDACGGTPQEFAQYIASETHKWAKVAVAAGLRKSLSP